jgi:NAD+ synthase
LSVYPSEEIRAIKDWFSENDLNHAVIGWSGGVDSATTSALFSAAEISTSLVVAEAPNQRYSSHFGGLAGAERFSEKMDGESTVYKIEYPHLFSEPEANEAALPIIRAAIFYGHCARLRSAGSRPLVVGTVNFSEGAFLGFAGVKSDMNCDFYPISHLSKSQVYDVARQLNVPEEIMNAIPSGDLLFEQTNDAKMIGATYDQIEAVIEAAEHDSRLALVLAMDSVDDPTKFADNIKRNAFKYRLSFPGFHVDPRLEAFRQQHYTPILEIAESINA